MQTGMRGKIGALFGMLLYVGLQFGQTPQLSIQTGHTNTIHALTISSDGRYAVSVSADHTAVVWDLSVNRQLVQFTGHDYPILAVAIHPQRKEVVTVDQGGTVMCWLFPSLTILDSWQLQQPGYTVSYTNDGEKILVGAQQLHLLHRGGSMDVHYGTMENNPIEALVIDPIQAGVVWYSGTGRRQVVAYDYQQKRILEESAGRYTHMAVSADGATLWGAQENGILRQWNPKDRVGTTKKITKAAPRSWNAFTAVAQQERFFAGANTNGLIAIVDKQTGRTLHHLNGHRGRVTALAWHPTDRYLMSAGEDGQLLSWAVESGQVTQQLEGKSYPLNTVAFSADGRTLYMGTASGHLFTWHLEKHAVQKSTLPLSRWRTQLGWQQGIADVSLDSAGQVVAKCYQYLPFRTDKNLIKKLVWSKWQFDGAMWTLVQKDKPLSFTREVQMEEWDLLQQDTLQHAASKRHYVTTGSAVIAGTPQQGFTWPTAHNGKIADMALHPQLKALVTVSWDGTLHWLDPLTGKLLVQMAPLGNSDFMYVTPDNYYFSSRGSVDGIGFLYGDEIFGFKQFDIQYNRPDIVLGAMGLYPAALVRSYYQAYQKRLQYLGFSDQLSLTAALPEVSIQNRADIPSITSNDSLVISYSMRSTDQPLSRLQVAVNGVPLYGRNGIPIQSGADTAGNIVVALTPGDNVVSLTAYSIAAVASLPAEVTVRYTPVAPIQPTLYFIPISVGRYQDSRYNLTYAAKDGRDLQALWEKTYSGGAVNVDYQFYDEDAIVDSILQLREVLQKTKPEDRVILFLSGHGLLDDSLNFWFATHDMDFAAPEKRGLAYTELEEMLDGIPARQKLLLMDACHSGEVDKEAKMVTGETTAEGAIVVQGYGKTKGVVNLRKQVGLKPSFDLMQELFVNLDMGSGAQVIAAAAGNSYALESDTWQNGVFTYALLTGITTGAADANGDGQVQVAELNRYVGDAVERLTAGAQRPTSRQENPDANFVIWRY